MKLHFLGTGGAVISPARQNTCLYAEEGNDHLLIDCNGVAMARLQENDVDYMQLQHVFLTHYHVDHIAGLLNFMKHLYIQMYLRPPENERRTAPIHFYGNGPTLEKARELLRLFGLLDGPKETFPRIFHELPMTEHHFEIGALKITSFPVDHGSMSTLGLSIASGNKAKIVYSADTEFYSPLFKHVGEGDILIHECNGIRQKQVPNHTSLSQLQDILDDLPASRVYLVHLPADIIGDEETALKETLRRDYGDHVQIAHDGQTITF